MTVDILLVEDSDFCIRHFRRVMSKCPFSHAITVVHDGQEACEVLGINTGKTPPLQPDAILLDLQMPRMPGLEFLHLLRSARGAVSRTPVICLTTSDSPYDQAAAHECGVAGYIIKDSLAELPAALAKVLRKRPDPDMKSQSECRDLHQSL